MTAAPLMKTDLHLRKLSLFNEVEDVVLSSLESRMRWRKLQAEEVVCRKGDASDGLYVVSQGSLLVYDLLYNGLEVSLTVLAPGSFFGELSVIDLLPRTAYIKATEPSLVGLIPLTAAQDLFYTHPLMAQRMMAHLAGKVREMTIERVLLSLPNAFQRVCAWLLHAQVKTADGLWLVRKVPKQLDLANLLNTSRETVSRSMARLIRDGVIQKELQGLRVLRPEELSRLAQEDSPPLLNPARHKAV
jgi:CRP/FNR family cyclic AMP-dependent transcriptional regulator